MALSSTFPGIIGYLRLLKLNKTLEISSHDDIIFVKYQACMVEDNGVKPKRMSNYTTGLKLAANALNAGVLDMRILSGIYRLIH